MVTVLKRSDKWSEAVMRIYQKYPASFRSSNWSEIVRLANDGDIKAAEFLATDHQDKKRSFHAQNIIARRIRIQRVALFKLQREHLVRLEGVFETAALAISNKMIHNPNTVSALAPMRQSTREVIVDLRRALKTILTDLIWGSILLGVKNMGEAIKPILRDNAESFREELHEVELLEDRLSIGIDKKLAKRSTGTVDLGSDKWERIVDAIYKQIATSNLSGLTLSEKIWDLTNSAEQTVKRLIASEISKGTSSRDIAVKIRNYVYTGAAGESTGAGMYKSPMKNAMRLARTATNEAYTKATAAWAQNKPWVQGIMPTLSPAHKIEDDCDSVVENAPAKGYSPEEFATIIPVHPHCMCYGTYIIDEDYLTGKQPGEEE